MVSKESSQEIKDNIKKVRNSINDEVMDNLAESLQSTDQRKGSSVASLSEYSGSSSYQRPANGLSIFDKNMNFERVPEKTGGEKLVEKLAEEREKVDDSWRGGAKRISSKSIQDAFFENLMRRDDGEKKK